MNGFKSIHPNTEATLWSLGLPSDAVTQGYGSAAASAGFHESVGTIDGHGWSPCVDLSPSFVPYNRLWLSHLVDAGFAAFARNADNGWYGSEHWHCIDVALGHLLEGVETQVHDWCNGRDGLASHRFWSGPLAPDKSQRESIREVYLRSDPRLPVRVVSPSGIIIPCYGFTEGNVARVEVRPLVEFVGGTVLDMSHYSLGGEVTSIASANPAISGDFLRADLRALASSLALGVEFAMDADGRAATVRLVRKGSVEFPVVGEDGSVAS